MRLVKTIRCTWVYELEVKEVLTQEAADALEIDDIMEGSLVEQKFEYLDEKGRKINPR